MAKTEQKIEIDDLTQAGAKQYWLRWPQGNIIAFALLEKRADGTPGYRLDCWYDSLQRIGAEKLGRKQQELGAKLLPLARNRMVEAMRAAGWQETEGETWQFIEQVTVTSDQATPIKRRTKRRRLNPAFGPVKLNVSAHDKATAYQRTIAPQVVTLTCKECGQETTRTIYPGAHPLYCEPCAAKIEKQKRNQRRMKSYYASQAQKASGRYIGKGLPA